MEIDLVEYRSSDSINKDITYELSALINADSLFYGVLDYNGHLVWAAEIALNNINLLKQELLSNNINIRKFKVGIQNQLYTIVPNEEYGSAASKELLLHTNAINDTEEYLIRNDYSEAFGLRYIYALPNHLVKEINGAFDNCSLVHAAHANLEWLPTSSTTTIQVHMCFYREHFDLTISKSTTLMLSNTFRFSSEQDVLYFLGLAFDRLQLDAVSQEITVGGFIIHDGSMILALRDYFGHVRIATDRIKSDTDHAQKHYHLPLYMISKCA